METTEMKPGTLRIAAAAGILAAVAGLAIGQDGADAQRHADPRATHHQQTQKQARQGAISFAFDGGTAVEYAAAVGAASGQKNVVVMPGCEGFVMPAVELSGVSMRGALAALEFASALDGAPGSRLNVNEMGDVYVVAPSGVDAGQAPAETAVFSLAEMVESGSVEPGDVLTAVEAALELAGSDEPQMRYHPETRLLMVRGSRDDLEAVDRVLDGVENSASVMTVGAQRIEKIRQELEETRAELEATRRQIAEASNYADEIKNLAEQGGAGPLDVLKAREEVIRLDRGSAELESRIKILEERLERERRVGQAIPGASGHTAH